MDASVQLTVNGDPRDFADGTTVADLVAALGLANERVAVEVNRQLVRRATWPEATLREGDVVEVVHFVGGG